MKKYLIALLALFFLVGCSTLKVNIDYDTSYDFSGKTKYAIEHSNSRGADTLTNDRIIDALTLNLKKKAYQQVDKSKADLIFVFHTNVQDKSDIQTDYQMIGYGGFGFGGSMIATTTQYNYKEGTLVIDALNQKNQKILWRGVAKDELGNGSYTPEEKTEYINRVITKLMSHFPRDTK